MLGASATFIANETEINCYGQVFGPYEPSASWDSSNWNVASVGPWGLTEGVGIGFANISANWYIVIWFLWEDGYCEPWFTPTTQTAQVEVDPEVILKVPPTAVDGSNVNFSVTVNGATATGFAWSLEAPTNAGNNPQVNFSVLNEAETAAVAHWFALPDSPCPTEPPTVSSSHPYYNSTYKIKVTISYSGGELSKDADFTVNNYWAPAEQVNPNIARVSGAPQQCVTSNGVWYVCGTGTLGRIIPAKEVFVPAASQFHAKTVAHEQEHENHWKVGNLLGHLHNPTDFYARVQNFTGTSQLDLIQQLGAELGVYTLKQDALYTNLHGEDERRAFLVSDLISPQYAYQNCGRFP